MSWRLAAPDLTLSCGSPFICTTVKPHTTSSRSVDLGARRSKERRQQVVTWSTPITPTLHSSKQVAHRQLFDGDKPTVYSPVNWIASLQQAPTTLTASER